MLNPKLPHAPVLRTVDARAVRKGERWSTFFEKMDGTVDAVLLVFTPGAPSRIAASEPNAC
jgi:hypothetical protein